MGNRPRTAGRLYSTVIVVPFTTWKEPPRSLARTWAWPAAGSAAVAARTRIHASMCLMNFPR